MGFCIKWVVTLGLVLAFSSLATHAQEAAPPPLPPLPGIAPPPPQKAEIPKLPKLKTIPEIPPAKQVAAKDAPPQTGWMDKAKGLWARFSNKPKEVVAAKSKTPEDNAKTTASELTLFPPPPIQPPVLEGENGSVNKVKVDPNIFAFDEEEKKAIAKPEEDPTIVAEAKPVLPPLPPVAKRNSTEEVSVPILPNPVKKPQEKKIAEQPIKREIPDLAAISFPNLEPPAKPATPELPSLALPKIMPPSPAQERQITATAPKPTVVNIPLPKLDKLDNEIEKKISAIPAPPAITPPAPPPAIPSPVVSLPKIEVPMKTPTVIAEAKPTPPKKKEPEKGWLDTLTDKALAFKDETKAKITGNDPNKDLFNKLTTKQPVPEKIAEKPAPKEKEVVVAARKSELPPLTPPTLSPPAAAPKVREAVFTKRSELPSLASPTLQPQIATAPKLPSIPVLPIPEAKQEVAMTPPAPSVPEIPAMPKPEIITAVPTPGLEQKPKPPLPLPELTLSDLKLPNDVKKPIEEAEKIDMPLEQKRDEPEKIITEEELKPKEEEVADTDAFEFDELNDKGKKPKKVEEITEAIVADTEADDPAFKFWKGHNFKTQVLPDVLNRKEYESRNQHLPKAVYREDLEQSLFVAVARGDLNAIRAMLNNGVDVESKNAIGDTPLVHAAINGQAGAVRVLLARGANPNNPNVHGNTAMQVAAERGREDIIDALFEMGAKATADYRDPLTPLQSGVGRGFASVYNAMLDGENPKKKQMDERNRALQALADAGPDPRKVISQGMPGLSKQIIDEQSRKMPGEPLTFDELERKLAYQEYVRKTGDDPIANRPPESTLPKLISRAGVKASPVPIPYTSPQPQQTQNPIVGLPPELRPR